MDKSIDSRRTTAISTVNGLPRRNQRVASLRDSADDDRQMELKETLKIRDREQFKKKDRNRDFSKRRRVDNNRSTHSSDEEYFEEEGDETRTSQLRRGFHTQRSSPVLRDAVDEVLGVPIPRRARSASGKKLHEHQNSGSGDRKSMPSPDAGSPMGSGSVSPPYSGASMKKKMKCMEPRTRVLSCAFNSKSSSLVQNDIEIEVAEALFDLMTQSHSQSQPSNREARVYMDGTTAGDELKGLNAERGKVENDAFKVRNEESVKANSETILFGPMNNNKGGEKEKEKVRGEPAQELVRGDGFVDRGKVGSPKESESSSCVKRNACDFQDPTLTKADYAARLVESKNKKEARIMIDLMALPSLPPSPERDTLPGINPKVTTQNKSEVTHKIGVNSDSQLPNLNLEKKRRHHGIPSVGDGTSRQPHGRKESNIQSPASLLSFPIGMGSWPCVLPHPGYMPSLGARSSMTMQPPQFKFVEPRTKRCTTHRLVADNIHLHQLLVTKSLSSSSGPTTSGVVSTLYGTKPLSLKSMVPTQRLTPGKDKRSDVTVTAGADVNPVTGGNSMMLQQATNQALAHNFMQNSGFTLALGQHQTTMMAPANSSGGPTQSNSSRKIPSNSFPEAQLTQVTFNQQNPLFPSNEAAASYMAMLQSGGHPIPIPRNVSMPSFKSGTSFLNSSYYSPPMFNIAQIQHPPSQKSQPPTGDNKHSQQPEKNSINNAHPYSYHVGSSDIPKQGGSKSRAELAPQHFPLPFSSMTQNSTIFKMLPELSWNGSNKAPEGKSQTDSKSENPFLASFYHQQQMQQLVLKGGASSAAIQPDYLPFLPKWDNFPRATTAQEGSSHQSRVNGTQLKSFQGKNTVGNTPSAQGHHPVVINSQPVVVSSLNAGQRNNASAPQETEGSSPDGGSTPACRRVVPSILSSCANQLSEIKYG